VVRSKAGGLGQRLGLDHRAGAKVRGEGLGPRLAVRSEAWG
jgi:hypothetical protein